MERADDDLGGEDACLLDRVCPECGAFRTEAPPAPCPRCGAPPPFA
jgi:rubrerythrin